MKRIMSVLLGLTLAFAPLWGEEMIAAELKEDFERALEKLPKLLRERVADVKLKRAEDLEIGKEMPLEYRLLSRAAYASFGNLERELKVYDAGILNLPTWEGEGPGKEGVVQLLAGEEFEKLLPKSTRQELFARFLGMDGNGWEWMGMDGKGPALGPVPLAAVLRAHAEELSTGDLPKPYPVLKLPNDFPRELRQRLDPAALAVRIDGMIHVVSPERQRLRQNKLLGSWAESYSLGLLMMSFREKGTNGLRGAYEKDVAGKEDLARRVNRYEAFREFGRKVFSSEEWRVWDRAEAMVQHEAGNVWMAARYSILASEKKTEELFAEIKDIAKKGEGGFERIRFLGTAVDLALATKDAGAVKAKIEEIPGETLGKWLRVKYQLRAAEVFEGETGREFVKAAKSEVEACHFPALRKEMESLLNPE